MFNESEPGTVVTPEIPGILEAEAEGVCTELEDA